MHWVCVPVFSGDTPCFAEPATSKCGCPPFSSPFFPFFHFTIASSSYKVLAGHDHDYSVSQSQNTGTFIIKSGTDFREFSTISVDMKAGRRGVNQKYDVTITREEVGESIDPNPEILAIIKDFGGALSHKMEQVIGETTVPLDSRFKMIRASETNVGNLICDIVRRALGSEICLLNSGTLRADELTEPGKLTMRWLTSLLPSK